MNRSVGAAAKVTKVCVSVSERQTVACGERKGASFATRRPAAEVVRAVR